MQDCRTQPTDIQPKNHMHTDIDISSTYIDNLLENIEKNLNDLITPQRLGGCMGAIDLTSLSARDTDGKIACLTEKLNNYKNVFPEYEIPAGICVWPDLVHAVRKSLTAGGVRIAAVAGNFPSSHGFLDSKIIECRHAIEEGADEIDTVLPLKSFFSGDYEGCRKEISAIKESVGDRTLKVILETGIMNSKEEVIRASFIAMEAGADFIKTSTGKEEFSATPAAAIAMCSSIRAFYEKTGKKVGLKVAGGIRKAEEAIAYYTIAETLLGKEWLSPSLFRIGATKLANNILDRLENRKTNYF